jgi:FMN phosphatase YigB (HAD superfamily)
MRKTLLLDFDGVILNTPRSAKVVSIKANKFVQKFLHTSTHHSTIINKYLYKTFGHTAIGLQKLGYDTDIQEYNRFVYNDIDYKTIFGELQYTHSKDIENVNKIIDHCRRKNINISIFSNSPSVWYINALYYMGINTSTLSAIDLENHIKPNKIVFDTIEKKYLDCDRFIFVDDSFVNFSNTLMNPKWYNIMLDTGTTENINIPSHINLKVIKELTDILTLLD